MKAHYKHIPIFKGLDYTGCCWIWPGEFVLSSGLPINPSPVIIIEEMLTFRGYIYSSSDQPMFVSLCLKPLLRVIYLKLLSVLFYPKVSYAVYCEVWLQHKYIHRLCEDWFYIWMCVCVWCVVSAHNVRVFAHVWVYEHVQVHVHGLQPWCCLRLMLVASFLRTLVHVYGDLVSLHLYLAPCC